MAVGNLMKTEVSVAASFISGLLSSSDSLTGDQLQIFTHTLTDALLAHYQHHWFPQAPCRGSGYRCLRINHKMDPLIGKAASAVGFTQEQLFSSLPAELTLWVDPYDVSYRIGEDGSTCVLYKSSPPRPKSATSADTSGRRNSKPDDRIDQKGRYCCCIVHPNHPLHSYHGLLSFKKLSFPPPLWLSYTFSSFYFKQSIQRRMAPTLEFIQILPVKKS